MKNLFVLLLGIGIVTCAGSAFAFEGMFYAGGNIAPVLANDTELTKTDQVTQQKSESVFSHDMGVSAGVVGGIKIYEPVDDYTYCRFDLEFDYQYLPVSKLTSQGKTVNYSGSATRWLFGPNVYAHFPLLLKKTSGFVQLGLAGGKESLGNNDITYVAWKVGLGATQKISNTMEMDAAYLYTKLQGANNEFDTDAADQKLILSVRYLF